MTGAPSSKAWLSSEGSPESEVNELSSHMSLGRVVICKTVCNRGLLVHDAEVLSDHECSRSGGYLLFPLLGLDYTPPLPCTYLLFSVASSLSDAISYSLLGLALYSGS